jgi:hypothetical protein
MLNRKQTPHSGFAAALFRLPVRLSVTLSITLALAPGCASTPDGASGQESALSGPKPSASCEQYLALLSDERKQPLLPQYGQGGSCWTRGKDQEKQCDETCRASVNQIIRANLNQG